jgi:hypothetical protein
MEKRLLTLAGVFSLVAFIIAAGLAKAAVFDPLPPHVVGIQMPCLCTHSPAEEKAFVEEAMHAAVIPAALPLAPLSAQPSEKIGLINAAKGSVYISANNPSRELMQALVHAEQRHVRVYLFTDDARWEHARMLVYRGGGVRVVDFPKPVMVVDDHIVDVDGKVVSNGKLAEDYIIDFIGLTMHAIEEESAVRW